MTEYIDIYAHPLVVQRIHIFQNNCFFDSGCENSDPAGKLSSNKRWQSDQSKGEKKSTERVQ